MKAIVVDDESSSLHLFLDQVTTDQTREYHFFKDNPEAIYSYLKENEVDAAFLDIGMPGINGIELAEEIIKLKPAIRIAFVTGMNKGYDDLSPELAKHVVGFVYKPINDDAFAKILDSLGDIHQQLEVTMFGSFDCFINGRLVRFSSAKAKELFALLIVYRGKSLTMEQALVALWPDKDVDKAKILYRDAVWRLRSALNEIHFDCVNFGRAVLILDVTKIHCDYYDVIDGKAKASGPDFLPSYEWSLPYQSQIDFPAK